MDASGPSTPPSGVPIIMISRAAPVSDDRSKQLRDAVFGALEGEGSRVATIRVNDYTLIGISEGADRVIILQATIVGNRIAIDEIRLTAKDPLTAVREACDRLVSKIELDEQAAQDDD